MSLFNLSCTFKILDLLKYIINLNAATFVFFFIFILLFHHCTSELHVHVSSQVICTLLPYISSLIQALIRFIYENIMSVRLTSSFTGSDFVSSQGKLLCLPKNGYSEKDVQYAHIFIISV